MNIIDLYKQGKEIDHQLASVCSNAYILLYSVFFFSSGWSDLNSLKRSIYS